MLVKPPPLLLLPLLLLLLPPPLAISFITVMAADDMASVWLPSTLLPDVECDINTKHMMQPLIRLTMFAVQLQRLTHSRSNQALTAALVAAALVE